MNDLAGNIAILMLQIAAADCCIRDSSAANTMVGRLMTLSCYCWACTCMNALVVCLFLMKESPTTRECRQAICDVSSYYVEVYK